MQDKYITVTQLTKYIKFKIDNDENLGHVFLRGEISNFKAHTRGHYYFTLKDENSRINAVMFSSQTVKMKFLPQDGMKVLVNGKISVYEATGGYQIYVNTMTEDGVGNLYVAFEQLKEKLAKEGLFDPSIKKPIPKFPETIGIITAPTGAAIRDILSTIKRRWPLAKTILFPSLVQGASAAPDIVRQIKVASDYPLDLLIVGRGGGSIEDMWCFNDEEVARAIYQCPIPTISAVGHEIDFTIADFVADLRAPTPTGAVEMAVPNRNDIIDLLKQIELRIYKGIRHVIEVDQERFNQLMSRYVLKNPMSMYEIKEQKFDSLLDRLFVSMNHFIEQSKSRLSKSTESYILKNPQKLYESKKKEYEQLYHLFEQQLSVSLERYEQKYLEQIQKLETLNPLLTIKRGYAIVRKGNHIIDKTEKLQKEDLVQIEFQDGIIKAKVIGE